MKTLKHVYSDTPHVRVMSAADFKALGVEEQGKVQWDPSNRHTAKISDAAAVKLLEIEPGDWELLDDSSTSDGDSIDESGSDEDDDKTASTSAASRTARRRSNNL